MPDEHPNQEQESSAVSSAGDSSLSRGESEVVQQSSPQSLPSEHLRGGTQTETKFSMEMRMRQAPLPSAEEYGQYEIVLPGAANRILTMAEKEQQNRHEMEREESQNRFALTKSQIENDYDIELQDRANEREGIRSDKTVRLALGGGGHLVAAGAIYAIITISYTAPAVALSLCAIFAAIYGGGVWATISMSRKEKGQGEKDLTPSEPESPQHKELPN